MAKKKAMRKIRKWRRGENKKDGRKWKYTHRCEVVNTV